MKDPELPPQSLSTERFLFRIGLFFLIPAPLVLLYLAGLLPDHGAGLQWLKHGLKFAAALIAFSGGASLIFAHYRKLELKERCNYRSRWLLAWILLAIQAILTLILPEHDWQKPYQENLSAALSIASLGLFLFYWITELSLRWQRKVPLPLDFYFWVATAIALFFGPLLL